VFPELVYEKLPEAAELAGLRHFDRCHKLHETLWSVLPAIAQVRPAYSTHPHACTSCMLTGTGAAAGQRRSPRFNARADHLSGHWTSAVRLGAVALLCLRREPCGILSGCRRVARCNVVKAHEGSMRCRELESARSKRTWSCSWRICSGTYAVATSCARPRLPAASGSSATGSGPTFSAAAWMTCSGGSSPCARIFLRVSLLTPLPRTPRPQPRPWTVLG
jgi:hypothetical protein